MAFLIVAALLLILQFRRFKLGLAVTALALVPVAVYIVFATPTVSHFFNRGGSANVGSLSQRTVAWSAALHLHHGFWEVTFGDGLARTSIPVIAQYRTSQILDSTWISALGERDTAPLVATTAATTISTAVPPMFSLSTSERSSKSYRSLADIIAGFEIFRLAGVVGLRL